MSSANKTVRQSVTLPSNVASQVRSMARSRRLSANRMLVELIENGIKAQMRIPAKANTDSEGNTNGIPG